MNKSTGFTLLDLLVTVAIVSILLTLGVPTFQTIIRNNRIVTQTNGLVSSLNLARSEAIKRGVRVTICKASNQNLNNCSVATDWEDGWLIFTDPNNDGVYDGVGNGELIIQGYEGLTGSNTLRTGANYANFISYLPDGGVRANGPSNGTFSLCDNRGPGHGRNIVINAVGRARVQDDTGANQCPP